MATVVNRITPPLRSALITRASSLLRATPPLVPASVFFLMVSAICHFPSLSRDGKRGKLQVNYGLLTDRCGCPVAVSVYEGNVSDPQTLLPQSLRLKRDFGIEQVVLVGDRGMISQAAVEQ